MSAEVQAGAHAGGFGAMGRLRADIERIFGEAGETSRAYAERVCAWLESIDQRLDNLDPDEQHRVATATANLIGGPGDAIKIPGPRPGYQWVISGYAVTHLAAAAADLLVFVGSRTAPGFRQRIATSAGGFTSILGVEIPVPSQSDIYIQLATDQLGGSVTANLIVTERRIADTDPEPRRR